MVALTPPLLASQVAWSVQDVPWQLEPDELEGETHEAFSAFAWLKPKSAQQVPEGRSGQAPQPEDFEFSFTSGLHPQAHHVVDRLRGWYVEKGGPRADQLSSALNRFASAALAAFRDMNKVQQDQIFPEAKRLVMEMTQKGFIKVSRGDLRMIMNAFNYDESTYWYDGYFEWWAKAIANLIKAILDVSSQEHREAWKEDLRRQLLDETCELYTQVDVRAWPWIRCYFLPQKESVLRPENLCNRIRVQLCSSRSPELKVRDLKIAADLLKKLNLFREFNQGDSHLINHTFNDKTLRAEKRKELMSLALKEAPRDIVRGVLRQMDEDLDESDRFHDDPEIRNMEYLLYDLDEDIRTCSKTYLRHTRTWIRNVVEYEELTPDQICEHIEGDSVHDDDNYEVLLKDAVNYLVKQNRTFEAAKMLARKRGLQSKVKESLRNDQQIDYLVSLYKEVTPPEDFFGPLAEGSMALPEIAVRRLPEPQARTAQQDEGYLELQGLLHGPADAIGVWWLWRCFDAHKDKHARAALIAIVSATRFFLVDVRELEDRTKTYNGRGLDSAYKKLIIDILKAKHLIKVVHYMEGTGLRTLQLALITEEERAGTEKPSSYASISPTIDLCWAEAFLQGTTGRQCKELPSLVWKFLRQDLCMTEALSNFEHRPLRKSQEHYALSLAWCPLVILRACCVHRLLPESVVPRFAITADGDWVSEGLDEAMHIVAFGEGLQVGGGTEEVDESNCNIWKDPEAVRKLKTEGNDESRRQGLERLKKVKEKMKESNLEGTLDTSPLFQEEVSEQELEALYERQGVYQPCWRAEALSP